jgi:hypothetical protein
LGNEGFISIPPAPYCAFGDAEILAYILPEWRLGVIDTLFPMNGFLKLFAYFLTS